MTCLKCTEEDGCSFLPALTPGVAAGYDIPLCAKVVGGTEMRQGKSSCGFAHYPFNGEEQDRPLL